MSNTPPQRTSAADADRVFAPCRARCPIHIDVPGYLSAIAEGRFTDALEIIMQRNPLPSVCGRICLRPCEEGCRRCNLDEPVAVAALKRAAADHGAYPLPRPLGKRPERVAIIGSGPTGLTAAHDLAQLGMKVTLFEEKEQLGGMLRYGIPNYRLPDYALDRDIDHIISLGVETVTGTRVGKDVDLKDLSKAFDAVLIATGLQGSRSVPIEGVNLPQVTTALAFLEASASGEAVELGERVVVVGGGNVAMDVARTAIRQRADSVDVICLESREEMPASDHEIEDATLEGVNVHCSWGPQTVVGNECVRALEAVRCTSIFDSDKRFAPEFDESEIRRFEADTVILAIGQSADVGDLGINLTDRGAPIIDPVTLRTPHNSVYAAGDVVCGPTKVIDAIAQGHRAAAAIFGELVDDWSLLQGLDQENTVLGEIPPHMSDMLETRRRIQMETVPFYEAIKNWGEIEEGYTEYEAAREAQRCLGCTTGARIAQEKCASCLSCMRVCPHGAPGVHVGGYMYFDMEACHACGTCASACPGSAISIEGCSPDEMALRVQRALASPTIDQTLAFICGHTRDAFETLDPDARIVTVSCLLRVDESAVLQAFRSGAGRVAFSECDKDTCRFPHALKLVAQRERSIVSSLTQIGMGDSFRIVGPASDEEAPS